MGVDVTSEGVIVGEETAREAMERMKLRENEAIMAHWER